MVVKHQPNLLPFRIGILQSVFLEINKDQSKIPSGKPPLRPQSCKEDQECPLVVLQGPVVVTLGRIHVANLGERGDDVGMVLPGGSPFGRGVLGTIIVGAPQEIHSVRESGSGLTSRKAIPGGGKLTGESSDVTTSQM